MVQVKYPGIFTIKKPALLKTIFRQIKILSKINTNYLSSSKFLVDLNFGLWRKLN